MLVFILHPSSFILLNSRFHLDPFHRGEIDQNPVVLDGEFNQRFAAEIDLPPSTN